MQTLRRDSHGPDVARVQRKLRIDDDGIYGRLTTAAVRNYQRHHDLEVDGVVGPKTWAKMFPGVHPPKQRRRKRPPLRERAYQVAAAQVGVMETGGNNWGVPFFRYARANGALGSEPWCGDFVAYCYRLAGSKAVTRAWAAVRLLFGLAGIRRVRRPRRGDLVRFTFDHVGMFVRDLGNGMIETIEGNTGASGAVSDSTTGGDGVYRKRRSKSLVNDYLRVWR